MAVEQRVLIYFDELVMALDKTYAETMDTHIYSPRDILSSIQGLHHVDAVEVVHSSWILNDDGSGTCKHCHRTTKHGWDYDNQMNYCPNCGADMR